MPLGAAVDRSGVGYPAMLVTFTFSGVLVLRIGAGHLGDARHGEHDIGTR